MGLWARCDDARRFAGAHCTHRRQLPNVYVYAANNPSESIIAKRRGYGTIVSHNVPPYGRAGAPSLPPCPPFAPLPRSLPP